MLRRNKEQESLIQFTKELENIFEEFYEFQLEDKTDVLVKHTNDRLLAQLDIDVEKILNLPKGEIKSYLQERRFHSRHFENLADYLTKAAQNELQSDKTKARTELEKVIEINEIADEVSKTFSIIRMNKNILVKNQLKKV